MKKGYWAGAACVAAGVVIAGQAGLPATRAEQGGATVVGTVGQVTVSAKGAFSFRVGNSGALTVDPSGEQSALMRRLVVLAAEKGWNLKAEVDPGSGVVAVLSVDSEAGRSSSTSPSEPAVPWSAPRPTVVPGEPPSVLEPIPSERPSSPVRIPTTTTSVR